MARTQVAVLQVAKVRLLALRLLARRYLHWCSLTGDVENETLVNELLSAKAAY